MIMATRLMNAAVALVTILANLLTISSRETKRIDSRMTRYMMTPNTTASTQQTYTYTHSTPGDTKHNDVRPTIRTS